MLIHRCFLVVNDLIDLPIFRLTTHEHYHTH